MEYLSDLREVVSSADTDTLESEKDFMELWTKRLQERSDENERVQSELLTSESLRTEAENESGEKELHIMWMTEDGIYCRKQGQTSGYEWKLEFNSADEYNMLKKVFESIDDDNMPEDIATKEFWEKYLLGEA